MVAKINFNIGACEQVKMKYNSLHGVLRLQ